MRGPKRQEIEPKQHVPVVHDGGPKVVPSLIATIALVSLQVFDSIAKRDQPPWLQFTIVLAIVAVVLMVTCAIVAHLVWHVRNANRGPP
jgi:tryptophan-rich sensory protein